MKITSSVNHALRETTVTAFDAKGNFLCCETMAGTGGRVKARLEEQVRATAEMLQRRTIVATVDTMPESRLAATRLA